MAVPNPRMMAGALNFLRSLGKKATPETPNLGTMYERAVIETSPKSVTRQTRTPSLGDVKTGQISQGMLGGFHPEKVPPGKFRIHEFPDYVTFEGFQGMNEANVGRMIEMLQKRGKRVVVPESSMFGKYSGKLFAAAPAGAVGAEEPGTGEKVRRQYIDLFNFLSGLAAGPVRGIMGAREAGGEEQLPSIMDQLRR